MDCPAGRGDRGTTSRLGQLLERGTAVGSTETQLLERFLQGGDGAAFDLLVHRHGPMVLHVCRQYLSDPNDVDDAFQATFLVLVRRAGSLRQKELVGNWLYGVATRVARRLRTSGNGCGGRQPAPDRVGLATPSSTEKIPDEHQADGLLPDEKRLIHEEVDRLPLRYRSPITLCYFEGLTHEEAATRLGWPIGTVKGRLARARELLRQRLTRRGVSVASTAIAAFLSGPELSAAVPDSLAHITVQLAVRSIQRTGPLAAVGITLSPRVHSLAQGVLQAMSLNQAKSAALSLLIAVAVVGGGATVSASRFGSANAELASPAPGPVAVFKPSPSAGEAGQEVVKKAAESGPAQADPAGGEVRKESAPPRPRSRAEVPPEYASDGGFGGMGGGAIEPDDSRITIARLSATIASTDKNPRNLAILKKLDEPHALPFPNETPLEDVLKRIKEHSKASDGKPIPIYIDPAGLQQADKTMTSPVVIDLEDVPLKFSLRLVLKQLELAYCIRDGVLIISSVEGIKQELMEAQAEQMGLHPEQYPMIDRFGGMGPGRGGMGGGFR